jgi:hypothetical protein
MKHLQDVNKTYFQHMRIALYNCCRLVYATVALLIHSILPFLFVSTASDILKDTLKPIPNNTNTILVRFNTKWKNDPISRQWRVLVNGKETLAHKVIIQSLSETVEQPVDGEQKFHFLAYGNIEWLVSTNYIVAKIFG